MAGIYHTMPFIRFFSKTVWLMRIRKRREAGSHISDMNESTAYPQFTLIGTPAKSTAKRFVPSSMIVLDLFSHEKPS
jgi:hypothetical protein